jgi:hypothetical protein
MPALGTPIAMVSNWRRDSASSSMRSARRNKHFALCWPVKLLQGPVWNAILAAATAALTSSSPATWRLVVIVEPSVGLQTANVAPERERTYFESQYMPEDSRYYRTRRLEICYLVVNKQSRFDLRHVQRSSINARFLGCRWDKVNTPEICSHRNIKQYAWKDQSSLIKAPVGCTIRIKWSPT